jgi:hypothetical protein
MSTNPILAYLEARRAFARKTAGLVTLEEAEKHHAELAAAWAAVPQDKREGLTPPPDVALQPPEYGVG